MQKSELLYSRLRLIMLDNTASRLLLQLRPGLEAALLIGVYCSYVQLFVNYSRLRIQQNQKKNRYLRRTLRAIQTCLKAAVL